MRGLVTRRARPFALMALLSGFMTVAQAQMCPIPGNPCGGGDAASQAGLNGPTGAGNPIDVSNGNKYQLEVDLDGFGEIAVAFKRHYNSLATQAGDLGPGWSHGFDTRLTRDQTTTRGENASIDVKIVVTQADGRVITFRPQGAPRDGVQRYASTPAGYGIVEERSTQIERLRAGRRNVVGIASEDVNLLRPWSWRWADGRTLAFDGAGRLRRIVNAAGDRLDLDVDARGRLHRLRDAQGRTAVFDYWDDAAAALLPFDTAASGKLPAEPLGARHRLRSMTGPDGRTLRYGYDTSGRLAGVWHADGTTTRYEYVESAGRGRLSRIVGRDGKVIGEYAYDAHGRAISTSAGGGVNKIELAYRQVDLDGGETWLRNSRGEVSLYRWRYRTGDPEAQVIEALGPGCTTCAQTNVRHEYDSHGRIVRTDILSPGSPDAAHTVLSTEILERDADGRVVARYALVSGERTLVERFIYPPEDPLAAPIRIERPSIRAGAMNVTTVRYNARLQPVELVEEGFAPTPLVPGQFSAIRRAVSYGYYETSDGSPTLVGKLKFVDGALPGNEDRIAYTYDANGRLATIRHPLGAVESFRYDDLGRLVSHTPLDGVPVAFEYDAAGRLASIGRGGIRSTLSFDSLGRIELMTDPTGERFTFGYDAASRLTSLTDRSGVRILLDLDGEGRIVRRRLLNPDGSVAQEFAARPEQGLLGEEDPGARSWTPALAALVRLPSLHAGASVVDRIEAPWALDIHGPRQFVDIVSDARGLDSRYLHDDFGRLVAIDNPDSGLVVLSHDPAGGVVERTMADGGTTRYSRDALGRVDAIITADEKVQVRYGANGKPTSIRFGAGVDEVEYDGQARVVQRTRLIDGHRFAMRYVYDDLGRLERKILPDGQQLLYRYNSADSRRPGLLSAIVRKDLLGTTDIVTRLNDADDTPNRQQSTFGNGLVFRREVDSRGQIVRHGTAGVADFRFGVARGQITQVTNGAEAQSFEYDAAGRFAGAARVGSRGRRAVTGAAYDWATNLIAISGERGIERFQLDPLSNRVAARIDWRGGRTQFRYDAAGRTTAIGERALAYDGAGRLQKVYDDGRVVAEYAYDGFGERIRKVVYAGDRRTVTYFFHDGSQLVAEADGDGQITRQYVYLEDRPVAMLDRKDVFALHTDWRGAPVAVTDAAAKVVWRAEVDIWHRADVATADFTLNLRGSNQYFDAETGLHYNIARYFDPESGRYLTPDPLGQAGGRNLYAFAEGDPVNNVDPFGLQSMPSWEQDRAAPDTTNISSWGFDRRLRYVLMTAAENSPAAIRDALLEMVTPQAIAITATIMLAWAASQLTPYGWAADLVLLGVGYFFMGKAILDLAVGTGAMILGAQRATCIRDMREAGRAFSNVMAHAAIDLGGGAATNGAVKVARQLRRIFGGRGRAGTRPPPPPPPRTLVRLGQVSDTGGRVTPTFSAGSANRWTRPTSGIIDEIGAAFEGAVMRFLRGHHEPRYITQPKLPNSNQGFDVAYLRADGKLVIGEAKSNNGRMSPLTAFGANNPTILTRNLERLQQVIDGDFAAGRISRADYDSMTRQISNRSFETELYVSSNTNIPSGLLDVFQTRLGRALDRVIVLTENAPAVPPPR